MKKLIFAITLLLTMVAHADILVVGDSHMAGRFGESLHINLRNQFPDEMIMVYGHASSAPIHWMDDKPTKLTGGVLHQFSYKNLFLIMPKPLRIPWMIPQNTISFRDLLNRPVHHAYWRHRVQNQEARLDTVVIALGANDRKFVSNSKGVPLPAFETRVKIASAMVTEIVSRGYKCVWVSQPSSVTRNPKVEQTTLRYIMQAIDGRCALYDSTKFVAKLCDQVHFNCAPAYPEADRWAKEVSDFIAFYHYSK